MNLVLIYYFRHFLFKISRKLLGV